MYGIVVIESYKNIEQKFWKKNSMGWKLINSYKYKKKTPKKNDKTNDNAHIIVVLFKKIIYI